MDGGHAVTRLLLKVFSCASGTAKEKTTTMSIPPHILELISKRFLEELKDCEEETLLCPSHTFRIHCLVAGERTPPLANFRIILWKSWLMVNRQLAFSWPYFLVLQEARVRPRTAEKESLSCPLFSSCSQPRRDSWTGNPYPYPVTHRLERT